MTEIVDNLYLGDVDDSRITNFIFGKGIALIVNCTHVVSSMLQCWHSYRMLVRHKAIKYRVYCLWCNDF